MKKKLWVLFLGLVALDQITKYGAVHYLSQPLVLVEYWAELRFTENPGVAFSIPVPQAVVFILATVVVIYLTRLICTKKLFKYEYGVYILIMAGAVGNIIDRIFNHGKVIDFISIGPWPVFNLADSYITVAILLYLWWETTEKTRS